jgi:hypothetical protein
MGCSSSCWITREPGAPQSPYTNIVTFLTCNHVHRYTFLHSATTVPVVPPRHDGYPRFLSAAWPYYVGAISTSAAFVLFSALWLGGDMKDGSAVKGKKKAGKTE